jgi:hypothetical protein
LIAKSEVTFFQQEMADITSKTAIAPLTPKAADRSLAESSGGGFSSLPSSIHLGLSERLQGITDKLQV